LSISGNDVIDSKTFTNGKLDRVLKVRPIQVQRNICVDKDFLHKCFASLAVRISSIVMSVCKIPVILCNVGEFFTISSSSFLVKRILLPVSACESFTTGVKAIITSPAGICGGTSSVIRLSGGISTVCVMVMLLI